MKLTRKGRTSGRTGYEAWRAASGGLWGDTQPARFHPAPVDGVPDLSGVFEDDLSRGVGIAGDQSELAGSVGIGGQAAALHDAPEV